MKVNRIRVGILCDKYCENQEHCTSCPLYTVPRCVNVNHLLFASIVANDEDNAKKDMCKMEY